MWRRDTNLDCDRMSKKWLALVRRHRIASFLGKANLSKSLSGIRTVYTERSLKRS